MVATTAGVGKSTAQRVLANDSRCAAKTRWLGLRKVGANPPVRNLYPEYDRHLELSIVRKSEGFFEKILRKDLDARNLIRSNSLSIDQLIAAEVGKNTRFPSIEISDMSGTGLALHSHTLAFDQNGTLLLTENSPQRLFDRLFVPDDAGSHAETLRRFAERRSILDNILGEAKTLEKHLGCADKAKLDEYLASVQETELLVQRQCQVDWVKVSSSTASPRTSTTVACGSMSYWKSVTSPSSRT